LFRDVPADPGTLLTHLAIFSFFVSIGCACQRRGLGGTAACTLPTKGCREHLGGAKQNGALDTSEEQHLWRISNYAGHYIHEPRMVQKDTGLEDFYCGSLLVLCKSSTPQRQKHGDRGSGR
jgi:hypothetical protein